MSLTSTFHLVLAIAKFVTYAVVSQNHLGCFYDHIVDINMTDGANEFL